MLSLARLDYLCGRPLQRIGLSATIDPLDAAAEYLAPEEVLIAAPVMKKKVRLDVLGPYADSVRNRRKDPVWEELGALVYQYCQGSRSVIAFVEGRRYAEKLAYYVKRWAGRALRAFTMEVCRKNSAWRRRKPCARGRFGFCVRPLPWSSGLMWGRLTRYYRSDARARCPARCSGLDAPDTIPGGQVSCIFFQEPQQSACHAV